VECGDAIEIDIGRSIGVQMGQARWAAQGTTLKSMALARPDTTSIVPRSARHDRRASAWAAASAYSAGPARHDFGVGTTPARFIGMIYEM